ncbi:MAG TPA: tetratricopeptide repeat protein [Caulobacteraceae bacterium]
MTDFLEEIEEQLRSDRYRQFFIRAWPWAVGVALAALLAALAAWGYQTYRARQDAKASQAYAVAYETLQKGDVNDAYAKFGQAADTPSRGYKALALMQQGGIRLQQGKTEEAVTLFDKAAVAAPTPMIGDMARLKSAFALLDTAPYPALQERLTPLIDSKRPYQSAAREALAVAKLRAGRIQDARGDYQVIQLLPDATQAERQRAQIAILAIDTGAVANLPQAIALARTLPPAPAPAPQLSNALPQTGAAQ